MAEWTLYTLHALEHGTNPKTAPWRAMFRRKLDGKEEEEGYLYSELKSKVAGLEAEGQPVPSAYLDAMQEMERRQDGRPLG